MSPEFWEEKRRKASEWMERGNHREVVGILLFFVGLIVMVFDGGLGILLLIAGGGIIWNEHVKKRKTIEMLT